MSHETLKLTIANVGDPPVPDIDDPDVQVWRENDGTVCAYGYASNGLNWMYLPGLASFRFGEGVDGIAATAHPPVREHLILDAHRRTVLPMALQVSGLEVLHASAVLSPRGVVALCAVSGTGKSTTASALDRYGWPLWADDAVAFDTSGPDVGAVPLPFGVRLLPDAAAFFGRDRETKSVPRGGVDYVEPDPAPLAALVVLDRMRDGEDAALARARRLSSTEAFVNVLAHAYSFSLRDVNRKRRMMRQYLELVSRVPVFEVRFRPGFESIPALVSCIAGAVREMD